MASKTAARYYASAPSSYSYREDWYSAGENSEPESRLRYVTNSKVAIEFQDFSALGEFLASIAAEEFVSVNGSLGFNRENS